jgi:hypothetical protein
MATNAANTGGGGRDEPTMIYFNSEGNCASSEAKLHRILARGEAIGYAYEYDFQGRLSLTVTVDGRDTERDGWH